MMGGGRRAAAPNYSLLATSPPTTITNDACSPHYPPPPSDDDTASSFEPPPPPQRHSPQLGVADWLRLQRQSSGSSVGGDDADGFSSVSTTVANAANTTGAADRPPDSSKSWAQQAEEAYQLQLALALRLCSDAAAAADPNFLDSSSYSAPEQHHHQHTPQSLSHRFWVNGCLSYSDKLSDSDGFYLIQGMDPFIWTLCTDVQDGGRIPSIDSLRALNPAESSLEVVIVDKVADYDLRQHISTAIDVSRTCVDSKEITARLAGIVSVKMG
ncbi:hypothetical protein QYE76_022675 [Lolium multiflorum]|uniref:EDR1/CTR1/ARMC3-like peptidase-like domain-containing protein n=1 Tax=Lolium multiflorum TaxID=4521 RepID=A0AAD8RD74_LOLMU|nr:hypothetical protein QYE76_022675 [Lolium multiflorum]